jgi:hypothetical protein
MAVAVTSVVIPATATMTGAIQSGAFTPLTKGDFSAPGWLLGRFVNNHIPEGMIVTAAYETISAIMYHCIAYFDQLYPDVESAQDDRLQLCRILTSMMAAAVGGVSLNILNGDQPRAYASNAVEASGVLLNEWVMSLVGKPLDHPMLKDSAALLSASVITVFSYLLYCRFSNPLTTNLYHGIALMTIYQGGATVAANAYPIMAKLIAFGHLIANEDGNVCHQ